MTRLYAATGDGIARLEESGEAWTVELSLPGSGAQCLAVDADDPDTVYAGLREGGVRRTVDAGRSWVDCALPETGVFSLAVSAVGRGSLRRHRAEPLFRSDDGGETWRELERLARASVAADLELPATAVDLARALDRAQPARRRPAPRRDRAGRADALQRRRRDAGRTTAPARSATSTRSPGTPRRPARLRGRRWRRRLE